MIKDAKETKEILQDALHNGVCFLLKATLRGVYCASHFTSEEIEILQPLINQLKNLLSRQKPGLKPTGLLCNLVSESHEMKIILAILFLFF